MRGAFWVWNWNIVVYGAVDAGVPHSFRVFAWWRILAVTIFRADAFCKSFVHLQYPL